MMHGVVKTGISENPVAFKRVVNFAGGKKRSVLV